MIADAAFADRPPWLRPLALIGSLAAHAVVAWELIVATPAPTPPGDEIAIEVTAIGETSEPGTQPGSGAEALPEAASSISDPADPTPAPPDPLATPESEPTPDPTPSPPATVAAVEPPPSPAPASSPRPVALPPPDAAPPPLPTPMADPEPPALVLTPEAEPLPVAATPPEPKPSEPPQPPPPKPAITRASLTPPAAKVVVRRPVPSPSKAEARPKFRPTARTSNEEASSAPPGNGAGASSAGAGRQGASGAGASGLSLAGYGALVAAEIARHKVYPASARDARKTGAVVVAFTVGASGRIAGHTLVRSSGVAALDAVVAAMMASVQAPPPPGGRFQGAITIRFGLQ